MCFAWFAGFVAYMITMAVTVYDGLPSLIFQPIIGLVVSAVTVVVARMVGLPFRAPALRGWWNKSLVGRFMAAMIVFLGIGFQCYALSGDRLVLHVEFGDVYRTSNSNLGFVGYFMLVFVLANWPNQRCALDDVAMERN